MTEMHSPVAEKPVAEQRLMSDRFKRFIGGSPLAVVFRLLILSVLVGFLLEMVGLNPLNILDSLDLLIQRIREMGFDTLRWLSRYVLLGAIVVLPIWFVIRLVRSPQGR